MLSGQQDGFSLEEVAQTHPTQVVSIALHSHWTKDCEQALMQCRYIRIHSLLCQCLIANMCTAHASYDQWR